MADKPIKLIVAGTRLFNHAYYRNHIYDTLSLFRQSIGEIEIVSGLAKGPDTIALEYAKKFNLPYKEFPADWNKHNKAAGMIRNAEMAEYADRVLVFWDMKSKGTKNMLELAKKKGLFRHVHILDHYPITAQQRMYDELDKQIPF